MKDLTVEDITKIIKDLVFPEIKSQVALMTGNMERKISENSESITEVEMGLKKLHEITKKIRSSKFSVSQVLVNTENGYTEMRIIGYREDPTGLIVIVEEP